MSKNKKKNKAVVAKKDKVTKKVVTKKDRKINPEKVAKAKDKAKKRESKNNVPAPEKLIKSFKGITNPIVASGRKKRALAVALAMCEKDDAKLAVLIRNSGIPFKQVNGENDVKSAELLNKSEWSGKSYAGYARFQVTEVNGKDKMI